MPQHRIQACVLAIHDEQVVGKLKQLAATLGNRLLETYKLVTPTKDG